MFVFTGNFRGVRFSYPVGIDPWAGFDDAPDTAGIEAGAPIALPRIILCQFGFLLPGYGFFSIDIRAVPYLFHRNADMEGASIPFMVDHNLGRKQDFPGKPRTRFHDQVTYGQRLIVKIEILYQADLAILGCDAESQ